MEKIVAAACLHDGRVWSLPPPNRHPHILWKIYEETGRPGAPGMSQGFLSNTGRYLTRREAAVVAIISGQISKLNWPPELFSEDLW